ncbi:apo-citrate lyase phosphoribosyl-ft dephospho-CoA transferase [Secundilactobacillus odoratitofui DSM 19909 = JCM 15043]|uniref:citrate lyase holo-[acyl-carrier protein] synthase n=1 Tax=Secundilactobacillus odoratitofui DSM 19909 = JCM 15043 TaxID=1423776 RepID=A0A0R1LM59_9LACO|nr:citrate lyase holo-[acyl-carrier protein] synthase [Secundilactobacillus odoratitofui]KRK96933.1 apo-citrate lyase phosphoribosyl-ft dephospho-CoA transferase [Secundilactobacillus odoratitofui DSM 19909 = JCM 15043]
MGSIFQTGEPQVINDVLQNRDQRVALQQHLLSRFPKHTLIAIKLNVPGPIKNNAQLRRLFETGVARFYEQLKTLTRDFQTVAQWDKPTGNELFITTTLAPVTTKKLAVSFEDHDTLGRLFDVDVLTADQQRALSRSDFSMPVRKCLICNRIAKDCARSRRHSVTDLQTKISELYATEFEPGGGPEPWLN